MVISDPSMTDTPIIFTSAEFERQTGYPPHEVLGRNCRFLQGPGTDPKAVQAIRDALAARTEITLDILNYRRDGSPFWNRLRIRPVLDKTGELDYYVGHQNPIAAEEVRPVPPSTAPQ
jgi:PAS domain S-box-containing protein